LFFFSGTAGLVYEILWMRYFQLLFGNTTKASATVLTVFFLGMAVGSALGGRWAHRASLLHVVSSSTSATATRGILLESLK
jgi:hypothetical protein